MKKTLLIALLLTLSMGTAVAKQQRGSGASAAGIGGAASNPVERLTDQLGLDVDQVAAITAIFEEAQALRDAERTIFLTIVDEIRTDTHLLVLGALTPEQQALHEELLLQRDALRQTIQDAGFGGGRGMQGGQGGGLRIRDCDG